MLLLACSVGALLALPSSGLHVQRFGARRVVMVAAAVEGLGLLLVAVGADAAGSVPLTAVGLFLVGLGTGTWDVSMNVEGAEVERLFGRSVMPRFHASFSLGTVGGASVGALAAFVGLGVGWHVGVVALVTPVLAALSVRRFLPVDTSQRQQGARTAMKAWAEPRTLLIGVMVLAMALTEGVANDWLAVAMVDGYDAPAWLGAAAFALFVAAMTTGRVTGTLLLDTFGRLPVLWGSMAVAGAGVLLVVLGQVWGLVVARHPAVGGGCIARVPRGDERCGRRPGQGGRAGQRRVHDRLHRVPRRTAPARRAGQPLRCPGRAAGRGRSSWCRPRWRSRQRAGSSPPDR